MAENTLLLKLESLFTGLKITQESIQSIHEIYDPTVAFKFNSLNFFRPGENKISKILGYFLDPNAGHGQGKIFLDIFISEFPHVAALNNFDYNDHVKVHTEFRITNSRRLDILLQFDERKFAIGIENKIWAKDQFKQIGDYNTYLSDKYGKNYILFYLTPYKASPSCLSINKEELKHLVDEGIHFFTIDYSTQMISIVKKWILQCRAERVKCFLIDFEQYLQQEINGKRFMNEQKIITDYVIKSAERIETALIIAGAAQEIKLTIVQKFIEQLTNLALKLGMEFKIKDSLDKQYGGFRFSNEALSNLKVTIGFEFQEKGYRSMIFGLLTQTKTDKQLPGDLLHELNSTFNDFEKKNSSAIWPWYAYFEENKVWDTQTYLDIYNNKLIEDIEKKIKDILDVILQHTVATV